MAYRAASAFRGGAAAISIILASCPVAARVAAVTVRVPASALVDGVAAFIAQTRTPILYAPDLLKGRVSPGVNGTLPVDRALSRLLRGSGVVARRTASGAYVLIAARDPRPSPPRLQRPAAADGGAGDIVVTGSRLALAGFGAPTPLTSLDADELRNRAPDNVATAIYELPQVRGSAVAGAVPSTSADLGTNGQNLVSLRNLGPARTLVLFDGMRLPKTNLVGSTDLNILPQALIKRVDVVTGGASASYGADAVAGVVNLILDTRFEGVRGAIDSGITDYGDNASVHVNLAAGQGFAGGRGRIVASAEHVGEGAVGYSNRPNGRDWFDRPTGAYLNPDPAGPRLIVVPDIRHSNASVGGLVTSGPLKGQQFSPGGVLIPFDGGTTPDGQNTSGGDGGRVTAQTTPRASRTSLFAHGEYDLTDRLTGFAEIAHGRSRSVNISFPQYQYLASGQFTIFRDNAYLPPAVAAMFAANPDLPSFTLGRFSEDMPPLTNIGETRYRMIGGGLKGAIAELWRFDIGLTDSRAVQALDRIATINRNLYAAADAVRDAAGRIVCRSNLTGGDPACVPMNLFGPDTVSAAAGAYVTGVNEGRTSVRQTAFAANLRGDLGVGLAPGAGPIDVALGVTYRDERVRRAVDPLSASFVDCSTVRGCPAAMSAGGFYGGYLSYNPSPLAGRVQATEAYAEAGIPILRDAPLARALNVTLAGRATHYNLSGYTYSWKVGGSWDVDGALRLRVTTSRDIRAPNALELFGGGATSTSVSILPGSSAVYGGPTFTVPNRRFSGLGNRALKPERGRTQTYGGVYAPGWAKGLQIALDYYRIAITDAIDTPTNGQIIDGCFTGSAYFCGLLSLDNGQTPVTNIGQITPGAVGLTIRAFPSNIASISTSGLDLDLRYARPLGPGRLTARLMANRLLTARNSSLIAPSSRLVGSLEQTQSWPRWTGSLSVQFATERLTLFVQARMISAGVRNANFIEGSDISSNRVTAIGYVDLTARRRVPLGTGSVELFLGVKNLLDQDPPSTATATFTSAPITNFSLYDVLGRRFSVGARLNL